MLTPRLLDPFGSPIRYYSGMPNRDDAGNPTLLRMPPELWTGTWADDATCAVSDSTTMTTITTPSS